METEFDEEVFLWALTTRPEDTKRFMQMFNPNWLQKSEYSPILAEVYAFTRKYGEPPSISTLHKVFNHKDPDAYSLRYKESLDNIQLAQPDLSTILFTLQQVKGVAVIRSLLDITSDPMFRRKQENYDGEGVLKDMQSWLSSFADGGGDKTLNLKEAIEHLINTASLNRSNARIPFGIKPIDDWTGGGLRKKQLGIIMAPTGHGKSVSLIVGAHKMAAIEQRRVWLITNELAIEEVTERALARLTGVGVGRIMEDPVVAYTGLERHWKQGLHDRLLITEANREVSTDDLEAEMNRHTNLYGWKPDVIVLDFMERMKPALSGYKRDAEWSWLGAIAKDLARMCKRHNLLIWTAAQTNRAGFESDELELSHGQSSIRHFQEATTVIGLNQVEIPNNDSVYLRFKSLKQRQSKRSSARPVILKCNLSKMYISNEEVDKEELVPEEAAMPTSDPKPLTAREKQKRKQKYQNQ